MGDRQQRAGWGRGGRHHPTLPHLFRGEARATGHVGEFLQGEFGAPGGRPVTAILTNPCPRFFSRAVAELLPGDDRVTVHPGGRWKTEAAVRLALDAVGLPDWGARVTLWSNTREGAGCGSSTHNAEAAIRATLRASGCHLDDERISSLLVQAEGASDSTAFNPACAVLWASRSGFVLRRFPGWLPRITELAWDAAAQASVDTLSFNPDYTMAERGQFEVLAGLAAFAIAHQRSDLMGSVATASATINERFIPKPGFSDIVALHREVGAVGVAASHTGTWLSLLFDRDHPELESRLDRALAALESLGVFSPLTFNVGGPDGGES
jgi:uncharacterized protein involved in propanediol utilization